MNRMNSKNISEKLGALAKGQNRSATARLREIFDDIEKALHAGVHHKDVHRTLAEDGFEFTFESFELAIYRIRKERKVQNIKSMKQSTWMNGGVVIQKPTPAPPVRQEIEPTKPAGMSPAAWIAMQSKAKN